MSLHLLETQVYCYGALDNASWSKVAIPFQEIQFILHSRRDIKSTLRVESTQDTKIPTCDVMLKNKTEPLVVRMSFHEVASALDNYLFRQAKKE
jgi:hypothetical protein